MIHVNRDHPPTGADSGSRCIPDDPLGSCMGQKKVSPVGAPPYVRNEQEGRGVGAARGKSLTRLWAVVEALRAARRGLTITQLVERTGGSRASIYRDLSVLRDAGVPIDKASISGEMRHLLVVDRQNGRTATPLQLVALTTARRAMTPLEGTRLMRELDALIRSLNGGPLAKSHVSMQTSHALAPDRLRLLDQALDRGRCVRIRYRGANDDKPSWRTVEPVELRVSGNHPYLVAYDRSDSCFKTYKLARLSQVQIKDERATALAHYVPENLFEHSRGIWSGDVYEIAVRLRAVSARFVPEWPLSRNQVIQDLPNGDVVVRARVAGLLEPLRWVLGWGSRAKVLEPAQLRAMVLAELAGATAEYPRERVRSNEVSPTLRRARGRRASRSSGN